MAKMLQMRLLSAAFCLAAYGCQTPTLALRTTTPARVFELTTNEKLTSVSKDLGPAPINRNFDEVADTPLLVRFDNSDTLVINSGCGGGSDVTLTLDAVAIAEVISGKNDTKTGGETGSPRNASNKRSRAFERFLLKAMKELYEGEYSIARSLAEDAAKEDPSSPAPHIISGLSYFQQGNRDAAKTALRRAKAMDAEDKDIDVLLQQMDLP